MRDENKEIPVCPVYKKCGGCTFQGISYEEQLKKKEKTVKKLLKGICPVDKAERNRNPLPPWWNLPKNRWIPPAPTKRSVRSRCSSIPMFKGP